MNKMKILIVLPDHPYFLWQMLVQINNFRKFGIEEDVVYIIGKFNSQPSDILKNIVRNGNIKSSFFVYRDERVKKGYSSSLRPFLIKKFFQDFPENEKETFFYTDPDVIFTKKMDFTKFLNDDVWYLSDTRSYLDSRYIISKSDVLFKEMCDIAKISPEIVVSNDDSAGGAQYLLKNTTAKFWEKVENDCEDLYKHMVTTSGKYNPKHPIQAWTSDMWAVLWNAWYFGHKTKIDKEFDFCWATDTINRWNETNIFHNAGVVGADGDNGRLFSKIAHQISPFNKELKCSEDFCSYNFVKEIKETEINFNKILF